jgi:NADH:ubiquinone oxidoreductase subunit 5 (subunit L)/multisubunit Na+/H+ antiporter MnhA subunit
VGLISFADLSADVGIQTEWGLQLGGVALASLGALAARALYRDTARTADWRQRAADRFARIGAWLASGWGFDSLYRGLIVLPALDFARATAWLDRRIFDPTIDGIARLGMRVAALVGAIDRRLVDGTVNGISELILFGGHRVARMQSGRIGTYVLGITAGVAVLVVLAYLLGA